MRHPQGAVVPRCFICGEPVVFLVGAPDCVVVSMPLGGDRLLGVLLHWRCFREQAPMLPALLQAHQDKHVAATAAARIARGRPADASLN